MWDGFQKKVTPEGHEEVIYAFQGGNDGASPYAGLTADAAWVTDSMVPPSTAGAARAVMACTGYGLRAQEGKTGTNSLRLHGQ